MKQCSLLAAYLEASNGPRDVPASCVTGAVSNVLRAAVLNVRPGGMQCPRVLRGMQCCRVRSLGDHETCDRTITESSAQSLIDGRSTKASSRSSQVKEMRAVVRRGKKALQTRRAICATWTASTESEDQSVSPSANHCTRTPYAHLERAALVELERDDRPQSAAGA